MLFLAKSPYRTIFLTPDETVVSLRNESATTPSVVRMKFNGSHGAQSIAPENRVETRTGYYLGRDPARWHADIPTFARIRYRSIYQGIDAVYYGNGRELEYDLIVAPHANPGVIDLAFDGADRIDIDSGGDIVLATGAGSWRQRKPVAYQLIDGQRRIVPATYVRRSQRNIGIALARYDHAWPLIIDPLTLFYSTYLGGSQLDKVLAVAADAAGNTYVAGLTQSPDFPTANAVQSAQGRRDRCFVAKINASRNETDLFDVSRRQR